MTWRTFVFLRPTLIVVALFVAALGLANATFLRQSPNDQSPLGPAALTAAELGQYDWQRIELPRPELSAEDIVRIQLAALRDADADGLGILQCFVFASPGNRQVTGPLERFGRMVREAPYDSLGRSRAVLIGRPQIERDAARILVTVVDDAAQVRAFAFILAKQKAAPVADCWMTDAVLLATPWHGGDEPAESASVDAAA